MVNIHLFFLLSLTFCTVLFSHAQALTTEQPLSQQNTQGGSEKAEQAKRHLPDGEVIVLDIQFDNFKTSYQTAFQAYFIEYNGYESHQVTRQTTTQMYIKYSTLAEAALVSHLLKKTANQLGFEVLLRRAGNTINLQFIKLTNKSIPYQQW